MSDIQREAQELLDSRAFFRTKTEKLYNKLRQVDPDGNEDFQWEFATYKVWLKDIKGIKGL